MVEICHTSLFLERQFAVRRSIALTFQCHAKSAGPPTAAALDRGGGGRLVRVFVCALLTRSFFVFFTLQARQPAHQPDQPRQDRPAEACAGLGRLDACTTRPCD